MPKSHFYFCNKFYEKILYRNLCTPFINKNYKLKKKRNDNDHTWHEECEVLTQERTLLTGEMRVFNFEKKWQFIERMFRCSPNLELARYFLNSDNYCYFCTVHCFYTLIYHKHTNCTWTSHYFLFVYTLYTHWVPPF